MIGRALTLALAVPLAVALWTGAPSSTPSAPQYTADGQLKMPERYREWVFLTSGVGMTYGPNAPAAGTPPAFDNVFVEPASYRHFVETGRWPDPTMFVLEIRASESHASINKGGHFQTDVLAVEAAVKDSRHPSALGPWSYYSFDEAEQPPVAQAKALPTTAACYSCHAKNTAVDNTFVQFYPVLYDVALRKGTLNPSFERLPLSPMKLHHVIAREGWAAGETALNDLTTRAPTANALSEATLTSMGNRLLRHNRQAEALSLLEWAAKRYPESARIRESLATARKK
jgi:hypothetical protein